MPTTTLSNAVVQTQVSGDLTVSSGGFATNPSIYHRIAKAPSIGTAAGNVNKLYVASLTVDTGTPVSLDLTALTDPLGGTINFAKVFSIMVENLSTTTGQDITIGGGANAVIAARADTPIGPNGCYDHIVRPNPGHTVDATHKVLTVAVAAGTGVGFVVSILGRTA